MNNPSITCPRCKGANYANERCADCKFSRPRLWTGFWVGAIATPVLAVLAPWVFRKYDDYGMISLQATLAVLAFGAFWSGFCYSGLVARETARRIGMTIVFSICLLVLFGAISFAGCSVIFGNI